MISARNPGWRASIVHGLIIGAYPLKAGNNQVILTSEMYGAKAGLRPWFNVVQSPLTRLVQGVGRNYRGQGTGRTGEGKRVAIVE